MKIIINTLEFLSSDQPAIDGLSHLYQVYYWIHPKELEQNIAGSLWSQVFSNFPDNWIVTADPSILSADWLITKTIETVSFDQILFADKQNCHQKADYVAQNWQDVMRILKGSTLERSL